MDFFNTVNTQYITCNTANFDPRKFLKEATNAMSDICAARFEAFGSAGNADKIKVSSLDTMLHISQILIFG
jgi:fructose-bisphosphate aldolase class II